MSAVRLHSTVEGPEEAPPVLMLGSLGSTLAMWDPQVPALAKHFRVVRADHRGHGGSPVPLGPYPLDDLVADVILLLDEMGIQQTSVVGLSLGGMVAMRMAILHPERLDRLALLCTSAGFGDPGAWATRVAQVQSQGVGSLAGLVIGRWFTPEFAARQPTLVSAYQAMLSDTPTEGYAGCCAAIGALDLYDDLARIAAPTLAIAGIDDPSTPPSALKLIADRIQDARLVVVPGAHLANVESPDLVDAALVEHLRPAGLVQERTAYE